MKKVKMPFSIILLLLFCLSAPSCLQAQRGPLSSQTREVSNFQAVQVSHGIDLFLTDASDYRLKVEASDDLLDEIETFVENNTLVIRLRKNKSWNWRNRRTIAYVSLANNPLQSIYASGGSDVEGKTTLRSEQLEIKASGGSDVELNLEVKDLNCKTSGGSDLKLAGKATSVSLTASGGSDIEASDLETATCTLQVAGGSDANVYVKKELRAQARGASDISYRGNPRVVEANSSGSSDITRR